MQLPCYPETDSGTCPGFAAWHRSAISDCFSSFSSAFYFVNKKGHFFITDRKIHSEFFIIRVWTCSLISQEHQIWQAAEITSKPGRQRMLRRCFFWVRNFTTFPVVVDKRAPIIRKLAFCQSALRQLGLRCSWSRCVWMGEGILESMVLEL